MNEAKDFKKPVIVLCDKCKQRMELESIKPTYQEVDGITVHYWRCTHCGAVYVIRLIDDEQRKLENEYQTARAKLAFLAQRKGKNAQRKVLVTKVQLLKSELLEHQKALKDTLLEAVTDQLNKPEK